MIFFPEPWEAVARSGGDFQGSTNYNFPSAVSKFYGKYVTNLEKKFGMKEFQIKRALETILEVQNFKGCFYNLNTPFKLLREIQCFFVVNTITDLRKMGHRVIIYIKKNHFFLFVCFTFHRVWLENKDFF